MTYDIAGCQLTSSLTRYKGCAKFNDMRHLLLGEQGERQALKFLKMNGYKIRDTNYRCPLGEIDIVASCDSVLVFLEVKTRSSEKYGPPQLAVNAAKQKKLTQLALYYLNQHEISKQDCRFDVVAVRLTPKGELLNIELIQNAFDLCSD